MIISELLQIVLWPDGRLHPLRPAGSGDYPIIIPNDDAELLPYK
jgi:hypothetical protein